jgi:hypothetical protein
MRNGLIGLDCALVFASTLVVVACSSDSGSKGETAGSGGSAGATGSSGGSAGTTGSSGGSAGGGGSATAATGPASACTATQGGTAVTSLCADAPLNTLTQAEASKLCSDTGAYATTAIGKPGGCKYVGIVAAASSSAPTEAALQAACSAREASCTQGASMGPGGNTNCSAVPATCTATVAQYSSCIMNEVTVFDQGANALVSCSMLTNGNLGTAYDVPNAAAEAPDCMAIKTACPSFTLPYID